MRGALVVACLLAGVAHAGEEPALAESEMAVGDAYLARGDWHAAIAHYDAARRLAPSRPGPYRALGMAYVKAGQCPEAITALERYVEIKRRDLRPEAVRALADCKARAAQAEGAARRGRFRVTSEPPGAEVRLQGAGGPVVGVTPYEGEAAAGTLGVHLSRAGYRAAVGEVHVEPGILATLHILLAPEAQAAPERPAAAPWPTEARERIAREQLEATLAHERVELRGSGAHYVFADGRGPLTENDFVRRYKKVTGLHDLDYALKMRNKVVTAVWASIGLAGVGIMAYGLATLDSFNPETGMVEQNGVSRSLAITGGTVHLAASLFWLIYGGLRFDGVPTQHYIGEYDARLAVDRYNRALEQKLRRDLQASVELRFRGLSLVW